MFSWHVGTADKNAAASDDDAQSDKDKAAALVVAAARQLVVGRGWQASAAIRTY